MFCVAVVLVGCAGGGVGAGPTDGAGGVWPRESPAGLTDAQLLEALLPAYDGRKPETGVERVFGPSEADTVFLSGVTDVEDPACVRWSGGLREAGAAVEARDGDARIAGAAYNLPGPTISLLVADPAMIKELERDALAACRSTVADLGYAQPKVSAEPLAGTARIGESDQAYRILQDGKPVSVTKEVRFGPYLLQVIMGGDKQAELSVARLDDATRRAYEHARGVLRNVPSSPASASPPMPTSSFAGQPPRHDDEVLYDSRLRTAVLPRFQNARPKRLPGEYRSMPGVGRVSLPPMDPPAQAATERAEIEGHPCSVWASGIWTAARPESGPRGVAPQYGVTALFRDDGLYVTEFLLWTSPEMIDSITSPAPPGECRSLTTRIAGRETTLTATPIKTGKVGDASWAFKVTTGTGDAPILIKWVRFGPYLAEIRIGTTGVARNDQVNTDTLDHAAKEAYAHAVRHLG